MVAIGIVGLAPAMSANGAEFRIEVRVNESVVIVNDGDSRFPHAVSRDERAGMAPLEAPAARQKKPESQQHDAWVLIMHKAGWRFKLLRKDNRIEITTAVRREASRTSWKVLPVQGAFR